jgi:hypothetical protein
MGGQVVFSDGTSGGTTDDTDFSGSSDLYRTYRGGTLTTASGHDPGGAFVLSGDRVYKQFPQIKNFETEYADAIKERFSSSGSINTDDALEKHVKGLQEKYRKLLQIHGAVMFGVAFLVRTRKETVTTNDYEVNFGNELQMLVATGTSFGKDAALDFIDSDVLNKEFLDLMIQLHPIGLGEGYCASDRYRIDGRPLQKPTKVSEGMDFDIYRGTKAIGAIDHSGTCD